MVKNTPAMQETWVRSLGWEDPLETGTATHSIILAWRIPWIEEPGRLQSIVLEKILESPYSCKKIKPVHPKGNQSSIFIGRPNAEAEAPILWPTDMKNWLIGKDPDAGKDWRREEKGTTEDEMVGWMASPTQWTCVWVSSGSWWWTGKPDVLQSMGSQKVGHNWATELNWTELRVNKQGVGLSWWFSS